MRTMAWGLRAKTNLKGKAHLTRSVEVAPGLEIPAQTLDFSQEFGGSGSQRTQIKRSRRSRRRHRQGRTFGRSGMRGGLGA